jgi:hypothetical protein
MQAHLGINTSMKRTLNVRIKNRGCGATKYPMKNGCWTPGISE